MIYKCHAKINLFLQVKNKRSDGYHNILSHFEKISLYDTLYIRNSEEANPSISFNWKELETNENILWKVTRRLSEVISIKGSFKAHVNKFIPYGSGLGGASSNAAMLLSALNSLFNINLDMNLLLKIAASIGADVPFFLKGSPAKVEGIGEIITPLPKKNNFFVIIVYPSINLSTQESYQHVSLLEDNDERYYRFLEAYNKLDELSFTNYLFNSFETYAFSKYPQLKLIKDKLLSVGAYGSTMTGSGSSIVGIFKTFEEAFQAFDLLKDDADIHPYKLFIAKNI